MKSKLLNEMPYFELKGQKIVFDLELENFVKTNNKTGCIDFITAILDGNAFTDKYGDTLQLQTIEEREQFKKSLLHNYQFNKVMQKLGISTHKLFQIPLNSFKQYHETAMLAGPGGVFGTSSGSYADGDARVPKILGSMQRRNRIPTFFKKKGKKKRKKVIKESVNDKIKNFLAGLTAEDVGKEQFGNFIVYFEGFSDICKQDLNARLRLPVNHPRRLESPNDIEKEIIEQWTEEMGSAALQEGWYTNEIFYAVFRNSNVESFNQFHEDNKSVHA